MKRNVDNILNFSFHEIKDLTLSNGYKTNIKDLRSILQNLEKQLIQDFFTKTNPYSELSFEIKKDIIKFIKLKYLKDELNDYFENNELIFQSLDVSIRCTQIPTDLYFLKTNHFLSNIVEFKKLKYLDIPIENVKQIKELNTLNHLIGLKIWSKRNINDDFIENLNNLTNLKFLYLNGDNISRKRLRLKGLKKLSLRNNNVQFLDLFIKSLNIKNSNLDDYYIKGIVGLNDLHTLKLKNCILPKNFLEILDSKMKVLKVVNCSGEIDLYPKKNFYIEKVHFENFKSEKLCTILKNGLTNVHEINFIFK